MVFVWQLGLTKIIKGYIDCLEGLFFSLNLGSRFDSFINIADLILYLLKKSLMTCLNVINMKYFFVFLNTSDISCCFVSSLSKFMYHKQAYAITTYSINDSFVISTTNRVYCKFISYIWFILVSFFEFSLQTTTKTREKKWIQLESCYLFQYTCCIHFKLQQTFKPSHLIHIQL